MRPDGPHGFLKGGGAENGVAPFLFRKSFLMASPGDSLECSGFEGEVIDLSWKTGEGG